MKQTIKTIVLAIVFAIVSTFSYAQTVYGTADHQEYSIDYSNSTVSVEMSNHMNLWLSTKGQWKISKNAYQKMLVETLDKVKVNIEKARANNITDLPGTIKVTNTPKAKLLQCSPDWSNRIHTVQAFTSFSIIENIPIIYITYLDHTNTTAGTTTQSFTLEQFEEYIKLVSDEYINSEHQKAKDLSNLFK